MIRKSTLIFAICVFFFSLIFFHLLLLLLFNIIFVVVVGNNAIFHWWKMVKSLILRTHTLALVNMNTRKIEKCNFFHNNQANGNANGLIQWAWKMENTNKRKRANGMEMVHAILSKVEHNIYLKKKNGETVYKWW